MKLIHRAYLSASSVLAMVLAGCSPNPAVLKERVYTMPSAPPVSRSTPSASMHSMPKQAPSKPKKVTPPPKPVAPPPKKVQPPRQQEYVSKSQHQVQVPSQPQEVKPEPVQVTSMQYPTSAPVKALLSQAEREASQGKLDKAASTLERALRIEPESPVLWSALSKVNARLGNQEQAASMAAKARAYQEQLN